MNKLGCWALALAAFTNANYIGGEIKTNEEFSYGRFSVRMQGANKPGTCTAFYSIWNGPNRTAEGWNEIDIELVPSVYSNPMSMNIIWQDK